MADLYAIHRMASFPYPKGCDRPKALASPSAVPVPLVRGKRTLWPNEPALSDRSWGVREPDPRLAPHEVVRPAMNPVPSSQLRRVLAQFLPNLAPA